MRLALLHAATGPFTQPRPLVFSGNAALLRNAGRLACATPSPHRTGTPPPAPLSRHSVPQHPLPTSHLHLQPQWGGLEALPMRGYGVVVDYLARGLEIWRGYAVEGIDASSPGPVTVSGHVLAGKAAGSSFALKAK